MPYSYIIANGSTVRTRVNATQEVEKGKLRALSTSIYDDIGESAQTFAQIGIARGSTFPDDIIAVLAQGYIGGNSNISWAGDIPLQPEMRIFVSTWSSAGADVRLHCITEEVPE